MKKKKIETKETLKHSHPTTTTEEKSTPPRKAGSTGEAAEKKAPASKKSSTGKPSVKTKPITFSLEEAREVAKSNKSGQKSEDEPKPKVAGPKNESEASSAKASKLTQETKQEARVLGAASLADILGRNPDLSGTQKDDDYEQVPKKFQRYYKALVELREHFQAELDQHTKDTLRRPGAEESSDRAYHSKDIADVATETFNHDFALSLVSSEQEALAEIQGAIERIHNGTYGMCEITGKPISKDRLQAVPFARYSVEGQAEYERTRKKPNQRVGAYIESGEEAPQLGDDETED